MLYFSVCSLGNNLVAAKRINQGRIIVFRPPVDGVDQTEAESVVEPEILFELAWRKTENFYMSLGCCHGSGLLACGDDRGDIWVYQLPSVNNNKQKKGSETSSTVIKMPPFGKLFSPMSFD